MPLSILLEISPDSVRSAARTSPSSVIGDFAVSISAARRRMVISLVSREATRRGDFARFAADSNWSAKARVAVKVIAS